MLLLMTEERWLSGRKYLTANEARVKPPRVRIPSSSPFNYYFNPDILEIFRFLYMLPALSLNKQRLEALTDGVFAIIMTLLVLELKIPHLDKPVTNQALLGELFAMKNMFFAYILTFALMITFWNAHHFLYHFYAKNVDRILMLLNMVYLGCLSVIPFSTGFLGMYWNTTTACVLYGINILLAQIMHMVIFNYVIKSDTIENHEVQPRIMKQGKIRMVTTLICNIIGVLVAFVNPFLSLFFFIFPIFFNTIPGMLNLMEEMLGFEIK
jgi:uncharacterized membrane protein